MFDNLREDWQTYERDIWRQGLWVMAIYRFGAWRYRFKSRMVRAPLSLLYKILRTTGQVLTGIELHCETVIGRRFKIEHFGDIIISGDAVFGDDCLIRNGVTVGVRATGVRGAPVFGDRVDVGAGAKILGAIKIGNDVVIGANAVVLEDVPDGCTAVGVPARIVARTDAKKPVLRFEDKPALRSLS
jgi:serine O-acetyltransferase